MRCRTSILFQYSWPLKTGRKLHLLIQKKIPAYLQMKQAAPGSASITLPNSAEIFRNPRGSFQKSHSVKHSDRLFSATVINPLRFFPSPPPEDRGSSRWKLEAITWRYHHTVNVESSTAGRTCCGKAGTRYPPTARPIRLIDCYGAIPSSFLLSAIKS